MNMSIDSIKERAMIASMNNMVREFGAQLIGLLKQYNMILEEMIKLRVFTDNAITLLKEQMDKTRFELKNDPVFDCLIQLLKCQ